MKKVKIRFNTNFPEKSPFEWRLIVDDVEYLVNSIVINTPCVTTKDYIEGIGEKYHIATEADIVKIHENDGSKFAFVGKNPLL